MKTLIVMAAFATLLITGTAHARTPHAAHYAPALVEESSGCTNLGCYTYGTATAQPGVRSAAPRGAASRSYGVGVIRSAKTGATATVGASNAAKFQAYIDDLEAHGASIYYMGGNRGGTCGIANQHACGGALDVCQDWRGHVSGARDCNLPRPPEMAAIAARHGLEEGGIWCNSDYGHAQVLTSGGACPHRQYATGSWGSGRRVSDVRVVRARTSARARHIRVAAVRR